MLEGTLEKSKITSESIALFTSNESTPVPEDRLFDCPPEMSQFVTHELLVTHAEQVEAEVRKVEENPDSWTQRQRLYRLSARTFALITRRGEKYSDIQLPEVDDDLKVRFGFARVRRLDGSTEMIEDVEIKLSKIRSLELETYVPLEPMQPLEREHTCMPTAI